MPAYCVLRGTLTIPPDQEIEHLAVYGWRRSPGIVRRNGDGTADFELQWSHEEAENVAEGDLVDDVAPIFPELLNLKTFHDATFDFQIVVGAPHPNPFRIDSHIVAMIAALGGTISAIHSPGEL